MGENPNFYPASLLFVHRLKVNAQKYFEANAHFFFLSRLVLARFAQACSKRCVLPSPPTRGSICCYPSGRGSANRAPFPSCACSCRRCRTPAKHASSNTCRLASCAHTSDWLCGLSLPSPPYRPNRKKAASTRVPARCSRIACQRSISFVCSRFFSG